MADDDLNKVLDSTLGSAIDSADVYFQLQRHESWVMEDGIIKETDTEFLHDFRIAVRRTRSINE